MDPSPGPGMPSSSAFLPGGAESSSARQAMLAEVLDQTREAVFGILPTGNFFYVNRFACQSLGFTRDELLTMSVADLDPYFPVERWEPHWQEVRQAGSLMLETEHRRKDGRRIPVEVSTNVLNLDGQELMFAFVRDITERQAADHARTATYRIAEAAHSAQDLGQLYAAVHGIIRDLIPAENFYIALLDPVEGIVSFPYFVDQFDPVPVPRPSRRGLTEYVIRTGQAQLLDEVSVAALVQAGEVEPIGTGSFDWLGVPLHGRQGVLGALVVQSYGEGHDYTAGERDLLAYVSGQVALAIERKRAEEHERFMRAAINHTHESIVAVDAAGHIAFSNPAASQELGYTPEEMHALTVYDLNHDIPPGDWPRRWAMTPLGGTRMLEARHWRKDGGILTVEIATNRFSFEGRELIVAAMRDVSARRAAEEALRQSEASYRGILNAVQEAIYIQDLEGRFLDVNEGAAAMYGIPREQLIGKTPELITAPGMNDIPGVMEMVRRAFEGEPQEFEFWGLRANGEVFPKEVRLYPGTFFGQRVVIALSVDISERKRTEEALRQSQKLESLGVLAGGIAHDFNNLLTAILGNLNLAQMKLAAAAPAMPHLEKAEKTVLKASELTRQMLAYSGKGRFEVKTHDLNAVVQEMIHLLRVSISKKVDLRIRLEPAQLPIQADATQIQQVVMNLVTNASEAIGESEGIIQISTYPAELDSFAIRSSFPSQPMLPGPYAVLEIHDSGSGMSPEVLSRIFDPFFTTKVSGRGLGLSAMLGILRGHKAGILVRSVEGKGSTFRLFFPAGSGEISLSGVETLPEQHIQFSGSVLLVDDEEVILDSSSAALEAMGFQVVQARDGIEALDRFRAGADALKLVLMDLTMPRMDGGTAFLAMHRARPAIPVILSSGFDEEGFVAEFQGRGVAAFLKKPYQLKELRRIVHKVLAELGTPG